MDTVQSRKNWGYSKAVIFWRSSPTGWAKTVWEVCPGGRSATKSCMWQVMSLGSKEPASTPQTGKETSNDVKTSSKDTQLQKKVLNSERTHRCNSHPMISKVQSRAGFFCPSVTVQWFRDLSPFLLESASSRGVCWSQKKRKKTGWRYLWASCEVMPGSLLLIFHGPEPSCLDTRRARGAGNMSRRESNGVLWLHWVLLGPAGPAGSTSCADFSLAVAWALGHVDSELWRVGLAALWRGAS